MKRLQDKYVGELGTFKVYRHYDCGYYYAVDIDGEFILSADTYCEVFDELAYIILEQTSKE